MLSPSIVEKQRALYYKLLHITTKMFSSGEQEYIINITSIFLLFFQSQSGEVDIEGDEQEAQEGEEEDDDDDEPVIVLGSDEVSGVQKVINLLGPVVQN